MYKCISNDNNIIKAVNLANNIVELYFNNDLEKFNEKFNYFHNKYISNNQKNFKQEICKEKEILESLIKSVFEIISRRIKYDIKDIDDYGFENNVLFMDWFLTTYRYVSKSHPKLQQLRNDFFKTKNFKFSDTDKDLYKNEYIKCFISNAYRAEMYCHKLFSENTKCSFQKGLVVDNVYDSKNSQVVVFYDMYTSNILSRMALEQFLKYYCDKYKVKIDKVKIMLDGLKEKHVLTNAFYNELYNVNLRGNANTHSSIGSYTFCIMHSIKVLYKCWEMIKKEEEK